jgi:putative hemolysin
MQPQPTLTTPFSVHPGHATTSWPARLAAVAAPVMDPLLGLTTLERLYSELRAGNFIDRALERLAITVDVAPEDLRHVPESGPTIVIANHPTGAADGLALAHALMRRRKDVRLLGNHLLSRVPEMVDWTIAVNPFDARSIENRRGLRAARAWLRRGGLLVVFPAGEVSNVWRADGRLVDRDWQRGVLSLARWASAAIMPAFIDARSSRLFRLAGLLHPRLRTALLPRELLRLRNKTVTVRMSVAVTRERLTEIPSSSAQLAYLRARTDALEPRQTRRTTTPSVPIVHGIDADVLRRNIADLQADRELLRSGAYSVFCAPAAMLPAVMKEIGRLREIAFRAAGEGTGRKIDLDRFDGSYQHLFVWNHDRHEIAGAYRIAATDRICGSTGVGALYSSTLFTLSPEFPETIGPALELGRSFVRREYQRESIVLLLLWKGIGALVAREPRYRRLFGPVSISGDYSKPSRALIARFLSGATTPPAWRSQVRPRRPLPPNFTFCDPPDARTIEEVDRLVREFDRGRAVPVLVRQYWKLGARVLGFSTDPSFGDCLDALMIVDLADVPAAALQRYLGRDGAAAFRAHHGPDATCATRFAFTTSGH